MFGATTVQRMDGPVPHAELDLGHGRLQLGDPADAYDLFVFTGSAAVSSSVCIHVPDVDAVFAAAVERGATVREKPSTFVTGDRFASVIDPFSTAGRS